MQKFHIYIMVLITVSVISFNNIVKAQDCYPQLSDTIRSAISALQANDSIIKYQDNPHFVIVDVRTPGEYSPAHIEQAININYYDANINTMLSNLDRNKIYLIYCGSGTRSTYTYNIMVNLDFRNVYNMSGGMGSWNNNSLPSVNYTEPQFTYFGDSIREFFETPVGATDSACFTITNSANAQLEITSITGLDGNIFSVEYDTQLLLNGSLNYTFYFYYTPDDETADSTIATITTNAGTENVYLYGHPKNTTNILSSHSNETIVFEPTANGYHITTGRNSKFQIQLFNLRGVQIQSVVSNDINVENLPSGMYILRATEGNKTAVMKFVR